MSNLGTGTANKMTGCSSLSMPLETLHTTAGDIRDILESTPAEVGSIHNIYAALASAAVLFDAYLHSYTRFRQASSLPPLEQEVVFLALSVGGGCDYCVATNSAIALAVANAPMRVIDAIRSDKPISEATLFALVNFTLAMFLSCGRPSPCELMDADDSEKNVLDIILAIAVTTLSNYTNHVPHTDADELIINFS